MDRARHHPCRGYGAVSRSSTYPSFFPVNASLLHTGNHWSEIMTSELDKLRKMLKKMHTGMMVTRRPDGHLVSRAMAQQKDAPGADLWFVTSMHTAKVDEIEHDPHVNVTFFDSSKREWISIAGLAKLSKDLETIRLLYAPDWKLVVPRRRRSAPRDPRRPAPRSGRSRHPHSGVLRAGQAAASGAVQLVKGWLTVSEPDIGEVHEIKMDQ